MARKLREKSLSGIYHVCLRGVNKQRIFEWPEDYEAMYRILNYAQTRDTEGVEVEQPNFYLYAYCLMDNHVHLLIQPSNGLELGQVVKRINVAYAMHFNNHYERVGHLFQDRYKSEPVNDRDYFFELIRYIHNNPVKAQICRTPDLYPHSSFCELTGRELAQKGQTPMCKYSPENAFHIRPEDVATFLNSMPQQTKLEELAQKGLTLLCKTLHLHLKQDTPEEVDRMIVETLFAITGVQSITDFQRLDKGTMRTALAMVREAGVSIRTLSRLTGVSFGIIRGAKVPTKAPEVEDNVVK